MKIRMIPIVWFALGLLPLFGQQESARLVAGEKAAAPDEKPWLVQAMPSFPGGAQALQQFFRPVLESAEATLRQQAWEGRMEIRAYLDRYGQIHQAEVASCPDPGLEEALTSHALNMPRWRPGVQAGRAVPTRVSIPIALQFNRP